MKAIAVIPVYNEKQSIGDLVFRINQFVEKTIVSDDYSTNGTARVAEESGAIVIRHFGKKGFGSNTQRGINVALLEDCDIIVTMDGDGQHSPSDMGVVTEPIEKGEAEVVIGSRFLSEENRKLVPKYRQVGIKIITWLYNVFNGQKITDAQCCFRAYKTDVLRKMKIEEKGFAFSTETLIKARRMGCRIVEVPIKVHYHKQFSRNSTLNPVIQGMDVAWRTIVMRFKVEILG